MDSEKRVSGDQQFESIIKLYKDFCASPEYTVSSYLPEVIAASSEFRELMKDCFSESDYILAEDIYLKSLSRYEMQGFIYGFRYAVRIMAECIPANLTNL